MENQNVKQEEKKKENVQTTTPAKNEVKTMSIEIDKTLAKFSMRHLVAPAKEMFERTNKDMDFTKEAIHALQILESNTYLQKATAQSIRDAVVNVALTGLTLNPALKYAYLVPRKVKDNLICVLDISYIGMIKLLTDAGSVKNIDADVIHENDKYDYKKGSDAFIKHTPSLTNRGNPIGAYAIAYFRDGGNQFVVMGKEEIEKVRATSESWKNESGRKYSPWETWTDEMWKKTALKRLFKLLPKTQFSEGLINAISHDHDTEMQDIVQKDDLKNDFEEVQIIEEA